MTEAAYFFSKEAEVILAPVLVPPRLYLLHPWDITWDGTLEALWSRPSVLLPKNVLEQVWELYERMTN